MSERLIVRSQTSQSRELVGGHKGGPTDTLTEGALDWTTLNWN